MRAMVYAVAVLAICTGCSGPGKLQLPPANQSGLLTITSADELPALPEDIRSIATFGGWVAPYSNYSAHDWPVHVKAELIELGRPVAPQAAGGIEFWQLAGAVPTEPVAANELSWRMHLKVVAADGAPLPRIKYLAWGLRDGTLFVNRTPYERLPLEVDKVYRSSELAPAKLATPAGDFALDIRALIVDESDRISMVDIPEVGLVGWGSQHWGQPPVN